jgi:thiamine biosynthesis lipoprotein
MTLSRRRFLLIAASLPLAGGARGAGRVEWRGDALGGEARIILDGPRDATASALADVAAEIDRLESLFSLHRPEAQLARLNRTGFLDAPARDLVDTLLRAEHWHTRTEGAFDPAIQPTWSARARGLPVPVSRPAARPALGPGRIFLAPGSALTLNGIAQGTISDRVADLLARRGFDAPVIDTGELRLPGAHRRRVTLPHAGLALSLAGCALATSEPDALRFATGGHHLLDPRSGRAPDTWRSVTVIAPRAEDADALSTAFAVSDPARIGDLVPADTLVLATDPAGRTRRYGRPPRGTLA